VFRRKKGVVFVGADNDFDVAPVLCPFDFQFFVDPVIGVIRVKVNEYQVLSPHEHLIEAILVVQFIAFYAIQDFPASASYFLLIVDAEKLQDPAAAWQGNGVVCLMIFENVQVVITYDFFDVAKCGSLESWECFSDDAENAPGNDLIFSDSAGKKPTNSQLAKTVCL